MDRFEALPAPQKALIGFLALALVVGLFYFLLIADVEGQITSAKARVRKAEQAANKLKQYESGQMLRDLEAEEAELKEQLAANKALLPKEEKIPQLITSIKRQADERGLKINLFKKNDRTPDDYVDIIPVEMEVQGSFPIVVSFFEALAQPNMRMMTVNDLKMQAVPIKKLMKKDSGSAGVPDVHARKTSAASSDKGDHRSGIAGHGPMTPTEQLIKKIEDYENAADGMQVVAKFTVHAYSYSGKLLDSEERAKRDRRRKKRRR